MKKVKKAMGNQPFDVAIVGLGPIGCAAAIQFAEAGLRVAAIERDTDVYQLPRAVMMDGEIVRGFQRIGLGEEVAALLQPTREGDRAGFSNSKREWLFGQDFVPFGSNGWAPANMFDQPQVDGYLRKTAIEHPNVTSFVGFEATAIDNGDAAVTVDLRNLESGDATEVTASYLLGCDGASSFVRKSMNVGWHDLGYDHDWLVVDIEIKPGHTLTNTTIQVCDPDRLATYVCTKDPYRRWEFKLNEGETWEEMQRPEKIQELLDPWTPRDTYSIRRTAVYQFHAAVADRWRIGRVLLAGDAAHQTPPFLGQGLNAGMRDVFNLAWKFPLVLSGTASEALLDTYQDERGAHATDLVQWAVSIGQLMEHLAATEKAEREGAAAPGMPGALEQSGYGQGREAPPLRAGAICMSQVSDTGSTGYLFSQPIVRNGAGKEFLLDVLLGDGFALVTKGDVTLSQASQNILDRLGAQTASLAGLETVKGHFDPLFENATAAIVRPDRHVFGHTDESMSVDDLIHELGVKVGLQ
ncbi:MAG: bifunctional 3-(3-hydroxy-phenyl)propionate/3-hydroxycinnamic acid hydroxylase [Rhodobiaceae bacterium]|nr:bifunctional 3-(3-hydroxy-phenyl)propionate/3-hydroxycinnamic acid hydroxylase [Rhodobiaceae bacterium]